MQRSPAAPALPGLAFFRPLLRLPRGVPAALLALALLGATAPAACADAAAPPAPDPTAAAPDSAALRAAAPADTAGAPVDRAVVGVLPPQPVLSPPPVTMSYTRAYVALGAGLALTLGSFVLAEQADHAYQSYLDETDPARIEGHYDDAHRYDQLAAATLVAGQAAILLGVYWRFVHPAKRPAGLSLHPFLGPDHAGVAFTLALP